MSNPNTGGLPGQYPGQVPPPPAPPQYQSQAPLPPANMNQPPGQVPAQPAMNQFAGQVPQPAGNRNKPMALIAMIVVAALVVIGGGAFALTRVFAFSGGYATPDDLAESIETAVETNSLVSLANALPPSEIAAAMTWQRDYEADGRADWSKMTSPEALEDYINEINIDVTRIDSKVAKKSDSLAVITLSDWDGHMYMKLELVEKLRERYEEAKGTALTSNEQDFFDTLKEELTYTSSLSTDMLNAFPDREIRLVAVNEGGRWYVSPSMTAAEYNFRSDYDGDSEPNYGADFDDVEGASSPEEAVSGMVDALFDGASMGSKEFYRFLDLPERRIAAVYGQSGQLPISSRSSGRSTDPGVQVDWGLSSTKVSGGAVVNFGTTSITAGAFTLRFNGDTLTYSYPTFGFGASSGTNTHTVRYTEGLVNPERLGIFTVKDSSGWHVSYVRTYGNLALLAATDDAVDEAVSGFASLGGRGVDLPTGELRDLAHSVKPVGAWVVIVWNFAKDFD